MCALGRANRQRERPDPIRCLGASAKSTILCERCAVRSDGAANAEVAELVDALDLGSSGATRAGSSPAFRTQPPQGGG